MVKSILFAIALLVSSSCIADETPAADAALVWLAVVDTGNYAESWKHTSPYFQKQVSSSQWQEALVKVRTPLGKMLSRKVSKSSEHSALPGAPDGEYTVITLETSFGNKAAAVETITVQKIDKQWLTAGYFIR